MIEKNNTLIEDNDLLEEDQVILMLHRYEHFALVFCIPLCFDFLYAFCFDLGV